MLQNIRLKFKPLKKLNLWFLLVNFLFKNWMFLFYYTFSNLFSVSYLWYLKSSRIISLEVVTQLLILLWIEFLFHLYYQLPNMIGYRKCGCYKNRIDYFLLLDSSRGCCYLKWISFWKPSFALLITPFFVLFTMNQFRF